ncbi:YtxH domain-containing protein [soil metagenome]
MSCVRHVVRASILGTLAGGAVGFVTGVLVAPNQGTEARRRMAYLLGRWSRQVAGLVDRLDNQASSGAARQSAAAVVQEARDQAQRLLQEADALMSEVRAGRYTESSDS